MNPQGEHRGLREALGEGRRRKLRPPSRFEPIRSRRVAAEIERLLGQVEVDAPSAIDLGEVRNEVDEVWRRTKSFDGVPIRTKRWIPWVVFFPAQDSDQWLGADPRFASEFLKWIADRNRQRFALATLRNFFSVYPAECSTFRVFRSSLSAIVFDEQKPRLTQWRKRCQEFRLLEIDGPRSVAGKWLRAGSNFAEFLEEMGFSPGMEDSEFLSVATEEMLSEVKARLTEGEDSEALVALDRALNWLAGESGLRFGEWRAKMAHSLLGPFTRKIASDKVQKRIRVFLLEHLGDPRVSRRGWAGVNEPMVRVMYRWLVGLTLDAFFKLLDHTALDEHWRYRKMFWSAYLDANLITDAWMALGPDASAMVPQSLRSAGGGSALLRRGVGVLPNHSVLLLKLGGATVAEWSHNGRCRIWQADNRSAPELYASEYTRQELVAGADFEKTHHRPDLGSWQDQVAAWIDYQLGITMPRSEYMRTRRRGSHR